MTERKNIYQKNIQLVLQKKFRMSKIISECQDCNHDNDNHIPVQLFRVAGGCGGLTWKGSLPAAGRRLCCGGVQQSRSQYCNVLCFSSQSTSIYTAFCYYYRKGRERLHTAHSNAFALWHRKQPKISEIQSFTNKVIFFLNFKQNTKRNRTEIP